MTHTAQTGGVAVERLANPSFAILVGALLVVGACCCRVANGKVDAT